MRQRSVTPDWINVIVFRSSDFRALLDFAEEGYFKITQDCVVRYSGSVLFLSCVLQLCRLPIKLLSVFNFRIQQ